MISNGIGTSDLNRLPTFVAATYRSEEMKATKTLKDYMSETQREAMKGLPTFHSNCLKKTGVAWPGKTERDRDNRTYAEGLILRQGGRVYSSYNAILLTRATRRIYIGL